MVGGADIDAGTNQGVVADVDAIVIDEGAVETDVDVVPDRDVFSVVAVKGRIDINALSEVS